MITEQISEPERQSLMHCLHSITRVVQTFKMLMPADRIDGAGANRDFLGGVATGSMLMIDEIISEHGLDAILGSYRALLRARAAQSDEHVCSVLGCAEPPLLEERLCKHHLRQIRELSLNADGTPKRARHAGVTRDADTDGQAATLAADTGRRSAARAGK